MNTKLQYMYRDADNYKEHETVILKGNLTKRQIRRIFASVEEDKSFIPQQVHLEPLYPQLQKLDSRNWDVDHPWHELLSITSTKESPTIEMRAKVLYTMFMNIVKWNDNFQVEHILDK